MAERCSGTERHGWEFIAFSAARYSYGVRFATTIISAAVVLTFLVPATPAAQADTAQIAFGVRHAVALRTNGEVITWGNNVGCQLGRRAGNRNVEPGLVLRNGVQVVAASEHSLALTRDGHVYGWGVNGDGQLGVGNEFDQCEGPALIESLEGKGIIQIATGQDFSVALSRTGELFCTGATDMSQCPAVKGIPNLVFRPVTVPAGVGQVVAIKAGAYHALALTKDGRLFAFGRGRDGQLGNGRIVNGAGLVEGLTNVVSFAGGIWHSAAVTADGVVWLWGSNGKSQLCDGTTTNQPAPQRVSIPGGAKVVRVTAGGFGTLMQTTDGAVYACGDNQFGGLGAGPTIVVNTLTKITTPAVTTGVLVAGGNYGAVSVDACTVRLTGDGGEGVVAPTGYGSRTFVPRATLTLCGPRATTAMADVVNPAPRGGAAGCWAPTVNQDAAASPRFPGLRQAMVAAENVVKKNAAFLAPLEPVRWRSSMSAGPSVEGGARIHIKVIPERKGDGMRLWTAECGVIPQVDRIGGAISQISVFFNINPVIGSTGLPPKLTGRVAGFPEYEHWVLITKDGRLPWVPITLADKLDVEGEKRERALADWKKNLAGMKMPDGAPAELRAELERLQRDVYPLQTASLERQLAEYRKYRAGQSPEALRSAAVLGDPTGEGKKQLEAGLTELRALSPAEEQAVKADPGKARAIRQTHMERAAPLITEAMASYDLANLKAGPAERAIGVKPDPTFPDFKDPNRIQMIAITFSEDPDSKNVERRAWQQRVKDTFDYAALAALVK